MDANLNRVSLNWGVPGLAVQTLAYVAANVMVEPLMAFFFLLVSFVGTVLLLVGLAYYAKAKGYSPVWGLLGLLSCIGIIILAVLPDRLKLNPDDILDLDAYNIPDGSESPFGSKRS